MKKTYPEHCLELAARITKSPWIINLHKGASNVFRLDNHGSASDFVKECEPNLEFIKTAPEMVPHLAIKLQKACDYLRELEQKCKAPDSYMIDELESMPEE